jgi:hypothetical protein
MGGALPLALLLPAPSDAGVELPASARDLNRQILAAVQSSSERETHAHQPSATIVKIGFGQVDRVTVVAGRSSDTLGNPRFRFPVDRTAGDDGLFVLEGGHWQWRLVRSAQSISLID